MPPLAFILERCGPYQELTHYTMPSFKQLANRERVTPEEIAEWLQAGKEKQLEHIAKLEADSQWRAMAEHLGGFPGLEPRKVKTTVPADPAERKKWHTAKYGEMKARETAQMIREPGDEANE